MPDAYGFPVQSITCRVEDHRPTWGVDVRYANYSTFNGGRRTPSAYSQVRCGTCGCVWRTKADYVSSLPDTRART